nr:thioredoxin-related transmembrane protein 4 [Anolis sagrei ordinatus]
MAAVGANGASSLRREGREWRATALLLLYLCGTAWASSPSSPTSLSPEDQAASPSLSPVLELHGSNWSLLLQGHWMVEFYAPWCPACQQMESSWEAFARNSKDLELSVGKVDVTQEPGISGRFFVTTLPTIYHAKDGIFRRYRGSRSLEDLEGYILEKKWEAVEPVAGWKSPSSILMHGMAGLFYLSGWIRQIHSYLTDTLGLHVWVSYAVFILGTLLVGLILGLILVLISDCISPSKFKTEDPDLMVPSEDKIEEQQEPLQRAAGETVTEKELPEGDNKEDGEEESQENSSDDSAVEGSQSEDELQHQESDKVEQSSVRQRKNQVDAAGL